MAIAVYTASADALRDTTKWLTTLVPLVTVIGSATAIGPDALQELLAVSDWGAWRWQTAGLVVGFLLTLTGPTLVLVFGGKVLAAQPEDLATVLSSETTLSMAFNEGAAFPYFLNPNRFADSINGLQLKWSAGGSVSDSELARTKEASDLLREWSLQKSVVSSFRTFVRATILAVFSTAIGASLCVSTIPVSSTKISSAQRVDVTLSLIGADDLRESTSCTAPSQTSFLAVGGTWVRPLLLPDGPGCTFGAQWRPAGDMAEVRPPATK